MNFDELRENCRSDLYKNKQPYVKRIPGQVSFYEMEDARIRDEYNKHCREAVQHVLGPITDKQFGLLFGKAWENGHPSGRYEVAQELEDLTYFIREWKEEERYINEQR